MLQRDQLDELSQLFAERLFERYPEWEAAARHDTEQPDAFCLEVPSPVEGRYLWCTTADYEITIGFGAWHDHYGYFSDEEATEDALRTIATILSDTSVVESLYRNGKWAVTRLTGIEDAEPLVEPLVMIGSEPPHGPLELRVQSWSGRLDKVERS